MKKVGILPGSFDPVHNGHIAFALSAALACELDKVIFLPEPQPRGKHKITSLQERRAMLEIALRPHKNLEVIELNDEQFSVASTLPQLEKILKGSQLYLLVGEDVAKGLSKWQGAKVLLKKVEVVVGQRSAKPFGGKYKIIFTGFSQVSSNKIRSLLKDGQKSEELPPEVTEYAIRQKLYR